MFQEIIESLKGGWPLFSCFYIMLFICYLARTINVRVLAATFGDAAFTVDNVVLFPGVMLHELSHAVGGFITGKKITKVVLLNFKPEPGTEDALGYVSSYCRGPWWLACLQTFVGGVAPSVVLPFVAFWIYSNKLSYLANVDSLEIFFFLFSWIDILWFYLFYCFAIQGALSPPDIAGVIVGTPFMYFLCCLMAKYAPLLTFEYIGFIESLWALYAAIFGIFMILYLVLPKNHLYSYGSLIKSFIDGKGIASRLVNIKRSHDTWKRSKEYKRRKRQAARASRPAAQQENSEGDIWIE